MKSCIYVAVTALLIGSLVACTQKAHPHGMPPGQAKKITGSKSAAPYAPGQMKKQ